MPLEQAVVFAVAVCPPKHCSPLVDATSARNATIHMLLSIDPDAIRLPVGSNLAAKISPEWPVSSITGDCRPLVRGTYDCQPSYVTRVFHTYRLHEGVAGRIESGQRPVRRAHVLPLDEHSRRRIVVGGSLFGRHFGGRANKRVRLTYCTVSVARDRCRSASWSCGSAVRWCWVVPARGGLLDATF